MVTVSALVLSHSFFFLLPADRSDTVVQETEHFVSFYVPANIKADRLKLLSIEPVIMWFVHGIDQVFLAGSKWLHNILITEQDSAFEELILKNDCVDCKIIVMSACCPQ